MANPGREDHWAELSEIVDNTPTVFDPSGVWVSVEPGPPTSFGEKVITNTVGMRYHPQITLNTILTLDDGTQLFVKGFQNVNRKGERLVLNCEEVHTP